MDDTPFYLEIVFVADYVVFYHKVVKDNGKADELVNRVQKGVLLRVGLLENTVPLLHFKIVALKVAAEQVKVKFRALVCVLKQVIRDANGVDAVTLGNFKLQGALVKINYQRKGYPYATVLFCWGISG